MSSASARARSPSWTTLPSRTQDRKSTRLNSSHSQISYAVFCLKKKTIRIHAMHVLRGDIGEALGEALGASHAFDGLDRVSIAWSLRVTSTAARCYDSMRRVVSR